MRYIYLNIYFDSEFGLAFDLDFEKKLKAQSKEFRGNLSGAGYGGNCRDIGFIFHTKRDAEMFKTWLGRRKRVWRIRDITIDVVEGD